MLTYTPNPPHHSEIKREYPWALLLLVFAWLWPGVFSHGLWNPSEPHTFAAVQESLHSPLLPTLFGNPDFSLPPVYAALARFFQAALSPHWADTYSAARFATVCFTALGLLGCGMAGYRLLGRHFGRSVVLILIGSVGLLGIGHFLGTMSVVFAGTGLAVWGLAAARRQVLFSALLNGLAAMLLSQSAGFLAAAAAFAAMILPPLFSREWRSNRYLTACAASLAAALPLCVIYPLGIWAVSPAAFEQYLAQHIFGAFGGLSGFQAAFNAPYYARHLLWFAFPALPLTIWTFWRFQAAQRRAVLPLIVWLAVFSLFLAFNPQRFQDNLILLLPALAVLGAAQLDNLRRGAAAFLNWFGIAAFGLTACFLWLGFFAVNYGFPAKLAERAAYFSPYYTPDIKIMPMLVASLFTPLWLIAITRKRIRGRQAVTNWAAGITLVWALLLTLFLPWLDAAKSYRPVVQQMEQSLPQTVRENLASGGECLNILPAGSDAQIAWQQYSELPLSRQSDCRYTLRQINPRTDAAPDPAQLVWQGKRPRQKQEAFVLLDNAATQTSAK